MRLSNAKALHASAGIAVLLTLSGCGLFQRGDTAADTNEQIVTPASAPAIEADTRETETVTLDESSLRADRPEIYTVVRGDTLWDITGRFFNDPWLWPQLWEGNRHIRNPHLIYPGDQITIVNVNGRPSLAINGQPMSDGFAGSGSDGGPNKLSPRIRESSIEEAIPTVPLASIRQFIERPSLVAADLANDSPYIIGAATERLVFSDGNKIYARGDFNPQVIGYKIYHLEDELVDPISGEVLGYQAELVGDARLDNIGDPSTLRITDSVQEGLVGDLILEAPESELRPEYLPQTPQIDGYGTVIGLHNAISRVAKHQVIAINLGSDDGVQIGDVFAVENQGRAIYDPVKSETVVAPPERAGAVMVFQTHSRMSFALVMSSENTIEVGDLIAGI